MWLTYALLAALSFGLRGILYQWTSKKPVNRNLMLFGVFLTGAAASLAAALIANDAWTTVSLIGCMMGVWSYIANAAMYKGFAVGKASLVALFTALPPVIVVCASYLLWGQTLNLLQTAGFIAIVAGIVLIRYSSDVSLENMKGLIWATIALFGFGMNDTTSTQAMLWNAPLFPTMFCMFATGTFLFGVTWYAGTRRARRRPELLAERETAAGSVAPEWRFVPTVVWGMIVGTTNFMGMYFILHAFDVGIAGLVSAVTSLNVLLVLVYAALALKERFSRKEWIGGLCSLAGLMVLHLAS